MIKKESRNVMRQRRHARVRKNISGTASLPRLNVFRSNKEIYAQVIDDESGTTLVSSSSKILKINLLENIVNEQTVTFLLHQVSCDNEGCAAETKRGSKERFYCRQEKISQMLLLTKKMRFAFLPIEIPAAPASRG